MPRIKRNHIETDVPFVPVLYERSAALFSPEPEEPVMRVYKHPVCPCPYGYCCYRPTEETNGFERKTE